MQRRIFYACLNDLFSSVAVELGQSKEGISVVMVFPGLDHFLRDLGRGESTDLVTYLIKRHQMLALIKQVRQRHLVRAAYSLEIWGQLLYLTRLGSRLSPDSGDEVKN